MLGSLQRTFLPTWGMKCYKAVRHDSHGATACLFHIMRIVNVNHRTLQGNVTEGRPGLQFMSASSSESIFLRDANIGLKSACSVVLSGIKMESVRPFHHFEHSSN